MRLDTIAAISTPQGRGGIGIIRISGSLALEICEQVIQTTNPISSLKSSQSRKLIHGYLLDENKDKMDEVLIAIMPPSRSYTGEMTVEINCHGGKALLEHALMSVVKSGARPADPGEFTRRALTNGKIDLIKAEAINDLINARTSKGLKVAWRQMEGGLTQKCSKIREDLISILSDIEATIDFEMDEACKDKYWIQLLNDSRELIENLLGNSRANKYLQHGCWVVLTGPPNSGKSSIFNTVLKTERSIVCELPGTTRDHISETIELDGVEVKITDTAGIRNTPDKIEAYAVERSIQQVEAADVVVYVLDQSKPISEEEKTNASRIIHEGGILLFNKNDLEMHASIYEFIGNQQAQGSILSISAMTRDGVDSFLNLLTEIIVRDTSSLENPFLTNIRQTNSLEAAKSSLKEADKILTEGKGIDVASHEIRSALNVLEDILGIVTSEDVLDSIFKKFCIGK
jgi:tRNA modification GTPase